MNAYLLSHNGLENNITMVCAINFLLKYYDQVFFLCKDTNKENIAAFFPDKPVIVIPFAESDEFTQPAQIIEQANTNPTNGIFVCGFAHKHIARYRRINNPKFLEYKPNDKTTKLNQNGNISKISTITFIWTYQYTTSTLTSQAQTPNLKKHIQKSYSYIRNPVRVK